MRLKHVKGSTEKIERHVNTIQADSANASDYAGNWNSLIFKNDNPIHIEIGMGKGQFILEMAKQNPEINFIGIEKFSSVLVRAIEKLEAYKAEDGHGDSSPDAGTDTSINPTPDASTDTTQNQTTDAGTDTSINPTPDASTDTIQNQTTDAGTGATQVPTSPETSTPHPYKNIIFLRMDAEDIDKYFAEKEVNRIYLNFSDPWPKKRHEKRRLTSIFFLKKYEKIMSDTSELQFKTDNRDLFDFSVKEMQKYSWPLKEVNYDLHENGPAENNVMTEYEKKFFEKGNKICKLISQKPLHK